MVLAMERHMSGIVWFMERHVELYLQRAINRKQKSYGGSRSVCPIHTACCRLGRQGWQVSIMRHVLRDVVAQHVAFGAPDAQVRL